MRVELVILNYNGRRLIRECLRSVVRAAARSRYRCRVTVIDNGSTDGSASLIRHDFPEVRLIEMPNDGLCSFNRLLADLDAPYALLLNNDIELAEDSVDPLIEPMLSDERCFMTAPLCWQSPEGTYEGFRTAVRWRLGLVQATARFPGCEANLAHTGLTASAGAALAVDTAKFNALGGFDTRFLPGRIEDLDFALRGYLEGWHARYVPRSIAYHRGMATFLAAYGADGCDRLALRNTLLWQWKNLRHPWHVAQQLLTYPLRIALDLLRWPLERPQRRMRFTRALLAAWRRWRQYQAESVAAGNPRSTRRASPPPGYWHLRLRREREYFRQFHPTAMREEGRTVMSDE